VCGQTGEFIGLVSAMITIDATALSLGQFLLSDTDSGLGETLPTATVHALNLIPGSYRLLTETTTEFLITMTGVFDYIPATALTLRGRGSGRLRVLETAMPLEELISTSRVGQITGSIDKQTWPQLVDPMGWPLLTDTGVWGAVGADLGANTDHDDRLYIFFGDTATNQGKDDPPINSDMVAWTDEKSVLIHGGHLPVGWNFVLPFVPTSIQGQPDWQFCLKCNSLFYNGDEHFKGVCPTGESHNTFGVGNRFVIPFEQTDVSGQHGWRFCGKCAGMFWNPPEPTAPIQGLAGELTFKGTCPAGGSHDPQGLIFVLPFQPDGGPAPTEGQSDWRLCSNCGGLHWDGSTNKGVCAGASGGGFHLNAVLDEQNKNFDIFRAADPIGYTGSLETPIGAFSFDGRVYVFAGIADERYSNIFRPGEPTAGNYLFSKVDPSQRGAYKTEFLFSPKLGLCAASRERTSFTNHWALGYKFVLSHGLPASPDRVSGWRNCRKCQAIFWDGDPTFKGVCQKLGPHEIDPANPEEYSLVHSLPEDPQNQANWRRCQKCLALFFDGTNAKGLCPAADPRAGESGHVGTGPSLLASHASIERDHKNQADWRFCGKCKGLFWDGDDQFKGICPQDHLGHDKAGLNFVLACDAGEDVRSQTNWRFCAKCAGLFFDGYIDKGVCPKDGKGHEAAGFHFSLGHGFPETFDRQPKWQFCSKCAGLYFNGFADKGVCPKDGAGHHPDGIEFGLRHNPGIDFRNTTGDWRFCTQCFGMVRAYQRNWFPWVAPWVVDNSRHSVLPQNTGLGLVMIGYDWKAFRLAWMPLNPGQPPRFDSVQYYHAGERKWCTEIAETAGYELFSHPFGTYTHVSAAWLPGPERWIVLYGTANDKVNLDKPAVARFSDDLRNWSDEIALFDPNRERAYGVYMHMPGKDTIHPNLPPHQPPGPEKPGWAYGIFLLNRFTTWDSNARILGIYYLLSFGSPYQVQVMHSLLRLP
jgi:hypothetical protein